MAELLYERGAMAIETTPGTAMTTPTHILAGKPMLKPGKTVYRPEESRGTRAKFYRAKTIKEWAEWETGDTGADTYVLPPLLNCAVAPVTLPTTPPTAVLSRLWTFARNQAATTEKTMTLWWGDPNVQVFRAAYGVVDAFTFTADGTGEEGVMMNFSGRARAKEKVSPPSYPAQLIGPMITPLESQLWIDSGATAIGTTAITGRVLTSEFSADGLRGDPKYTWVGPGGSKTFNRFGAVTSNAQLKLRFELFDTTQYDLIQNDTILKVRVRHNGPLIETISSTSFYHYIEYDVYGVVDAPEWGEAFGSNRTLDITLMSQYDATAGHDWCIRCQNDRTSL